MPGWLDAYLCFLSPVSLAASRFCCSGTMSSRANERRRLSTCHENARVAPVSHAVSLSGSLGHLSNGCGVASLVITTYDHDRGGRRRQQRGKSHHRGRCWFPAIGREQMRRGVACRRARDARAEASQHGSRDVNVIHKRHTAVMYVPVYLAEAKKPRE